MKLDFLQENIVRIISQRNAWISFASLMILSNVILGTILFFKREKIIIVPGQITKSFWVQGSEVSQEYLEEIGLYMSKLLLDLSPSSFSYNHEILLKYVVPESYGQLKKKFLKEGENYKSLQLTTHFKPSQIIASPKSLEVEIQGTLTSYIAGNRVQDSQETLHFKFANRGGGILLEQVSSSLFLQSNSVGEKNDGF